MAKLSDLIVFDSLTIHKIVVSPKRVYAVYTIVKNDGTELSNMLIYTYNVKLFDKKDPDDLNLASLMLAQVAMNYGLFCKKIIFDGLYDSHDKRLIIDMIENTCREIYVNKLLSKNEFLKSPIDKLKVEKKKKYTAAKILFINTNNWVSKKDKVVESPDKNKYAILSSGGKDSLLSYGILNEHFEAHPVYVNESGRHWYTAYNAYHQFQKSEKNTAKVWCNSDRIFNWMLRHMPFIKENFQNIRSDIYPIRLWTVAVFLFGVLPIARKRNIKNIIIGNEYDTTLTLNYNGITHYAALYDQSKYFDNAFSRFYKKKGWNHFQFSLLRSLSELMIEKILIKRYPELQKHQVSCHSAHKKGERMMPCANCEKCRRIVAMLRALSEDPKNCGYTEEQIKKCLSSLETQKVKQIGSDAQHLYHMLLQNKILPRTAELERMSRNNPEIMSLRFDNQRSCMEDLPEYVRKPLFKILNKYSSGPVKRKDRKWLSYKITEKELSLPYRMTIENERK
ncbi:MAG: hypothetical protein HKN22_05530 [Bacteroidia bacterium]|nr:hypothetical protein [Bacteroidia bacterium]